MSFRKAVGLTFFFRRYAPKPMVTLQVNLALATMCSSP
jgi:hypothetical protein